MHIEDRRASDEPNLAARRLSVSHGDCPLSSGTDIRPNPASSCQSNGEGVGHSKVRCTQLSDLQSMILFVGSLPLSMPWRSLGRRQLLVARGR